MKNPAHYMPSRRRSEDKTSWRDQLSPRIKSLRGFKSRRHSEAKPPPEPKNDFRIVHSPDRPLRRITQEEIPSDEECRAFLIGLRRGSVESHAAKSMSEGDDEDEETTGWDRDSTITRLGLTLQTPEDGRADMAEDGIMTARTYSPHPFIGEAKEVKLEKVATPQLTPSNLSPNHTPKLRHSPIPTQQEGIINEEWRWRLSPTQLGRRPSNPDDALRSRPGHVRVRTNSISDPLCRVCHDGLAETSGICQACSDDLSLHRPPTLSHAKASIPHTLNQIACQHRATPSLTSNPEANTTSPPESPYQTVHTVVTMDNPPLTPLSALPTPHLLARLERGAGDVYEEGWADYYFDDDNFEGDKGTKGEEVEAEAFMTTELSLEEYDKAFASPVCPGPGWI